jgi:hypothetical protein
MWLEYGNDYKPTQIISTWYERGEKRRGNGELSGVGDKEDGLEQQQ